LFLFILTLEESNMGLKPRYRSNGKQSVIAALQVMIDNLRTKLRIIDRVSFDLDTEEEERKTFELLGEPRPSSEELRQLVGERGDKSIRKLGHIQRRIDEVRWLKEAFEAPEVPTSEILGKTYVALRSSLTLEAIQLCLGNPREQIFAVGINSLSLGKEKAEEIERLGKTIQAYSQALVFGFRVDTFFWNEFPFDDP
jgi:hypothetical protein